MAVSISCPSCQSSFSVSEELLGKKIRCKKCSEVFTAAAAKVKVGGRAAEEVVPSRSAGRVSARRNEMDDDEPVGKSGSKQTLLIGGIVGGLILLVGGGALGMMLMNKQADVNNTPIASNSTVPNFGEIKAPAKTETTTPTKAATKSVKTEEVVKKEEKPWVLKFTAPATNYPPAIPEATLAKVKKSAVMVYSTSDEGGGSGSGWFGEPGIVLTNSHVVGMKGAAAGPPVSIKIKLDAGLATERLLPGTLLGLDRENDLAVIRVEGTDLPEPMAITPSSALYESQRAYTLGFPWGDRVANMMADDGNKLKTQLTVRQTSVSGRMYYEEGGGVRLVQFEGGADHGNSGGAMVDTNGAVRAILVMGIPGTTLRWGIPSEYAMYLLQGRILKITPGQSYRSESTVRQPMIAAIADPLGRISKVSLEIWVGNKPESVALRVRSPGESTPKPLPGDGPRQVVEMNFDPAQSVPVGEAKSAQAEFDAPTPGPNQVVWIQPRYANSKGQERWGEAVVVTLPDRPVDRKPVRLAVKHQKGTERKMEILSRMSTGASVGGTGASDRSIRVNAMESVKDVDKEGSAKVRLAYSNLRMSDTEMDQAYRDILRGAFESADYMTSDMTVTKTGQVRKPEIDLKKVPPVVRGFLNSFGVQSIQSLEVCSMFLPEKELQPGAKWPGAVNFSVLAPRLSRGKNIFVQNALFNVEYEYVGTRMRDGREEAVIVMTGDISKGDTSDSPAEVPSKSIGKIQAREDRGEKKRGIHGFIVGSGIVDVATGVVTLARFRMDAEFEFPIANPDSPLDEINATAGGYMEVSLRRSLDKELKATDFLKSVPQLLPNQPRTFVPLVGHPGRPIDGEAGK